MVVGGIVPDRDESELLGAGVARVFHPGALSDDIVGPIAEFVEQVRRDHATLAAARCSITGPRVRLYTHQRSGFQVQPLRKQPCDGARQDVPHPRHCHPWVAGRAN